MKLSLPKHYSRRIARAIAEFDLISDGDNIVVGFSGGQDSAFLLYALANFQQNAAINFKLSAITVDLGFEENLNFSALKEYCAGLEIPYYIKKTDIADIILKETIKNPCSKCAYFRKGAISEFMNENKFNKIAYGHHYDDVVETFLLSIIYSGQIKTFKPKSFLSNNSIYAIRPLVYLREEKVKAAKQFIGYEAKDSPCPYDGNTKREEIKQLIKNFEYSDQIFYNLASAMREGNEIQLWPEELTGAEIKLRLNKLWGYN